MVKVLSSHLILSETLNCPVHRAVQVTMLRTIGRTEGLAALYSGLLPTLLRTVPATATLLLVVENSKTLLDTLLH